METFYILASSKGRQKRLFAVPARSRTRAHSEASTMYRKAENLIPGIWIDTRTVQLRADGKYVEVGGIR